MKDEDRAAAVGVGLERVELLLQEGCGGAGDHDRGGIVGHGAGGRRIERVGGVVVALERLLDLAVVGLIEAVEIALAVASGEVDLLLRPGQLDQGGGDVLLGGAGAFCFLSPI